VNLRPLLRSREFWLTLLAAAVISVITRPVFSLTPTFGVEASWRAALHMAANQDLNFGSDIIFAYGPLGWLSLPGYWFENTGALAVAYSFAEPFVFAALLIEVLRRRFGWAAALALGFAVISMSLDPIYQPRLPLIALIASAVIVARPHGGPGSVLPDRALALALAGGVVSGFALLGRVNAGVMAALIVLAALLFIDGRRRNLPLFVVATCVTVLAGWLLTGQSIGDLPRYAWYMFQIGSGYAEAMQVEVTGLGWEYIAAFVLAAASLGSVWLTAPDKRARAGLVAVWIVAMFFAFKQGFVRHDAHSLFFFETVILFALVLPWKVSERVPVLAAAAAAIVVFVIAANRPIGDVVGPAGRTSEAMQALHTLVDGDLRSKHRRDGQAFVLAQLAVPPDYINQLRENTATAWPNEQSIVWAAGGKLRPLTTLQTYQAYTPGLDKLNTELLEDDGRSPERLIFLRYDQFDRRATAFEAPRALRALFCNYELQSRSFQLQMWTRTGDRCMTPPRPAGTVQAAWGERVPIPAPSTPDSFVYVEIDGAQVKGLEKLRAIAFKSFIRVAVLDGNRRKRVIPAVAAEGAVVRTGRGIELRRPFQLSAGANEMTLLKRGGSVPPGKPLTFRFFDQRVATR
jgi:hypothetical protein